MASAAAATNAGTANLIGGVGSNSSNNSVAGSEPPSPLAHNHNTNATFHNHRSPQAQQNIKEKASLYGGATGSYNTGSNVMANTNYSGWNAQYADLSIILLFIVYKYTI